MARGGSVPDSGAALGAVLTPAFLRKLDRLRLRVGATLGARPGNTPVRRGTQHGGIEIESHKEYEAGDDPRHIDWNAFGRLERLLVKTHRAEREAPLHLCVDTSASMAFPAADNKFGFALGLAVSLGYVSLRNHDPVRVVPLGAGPRRDATSPLFRFRQALPSLREFLVSLAATGETRLGAGLQAAFAAPAGAGVIVVISDFLAPPADYEPALAELAARRFSVAAVRVLGAAEREPAGGLRDALVRDAESGRERRVRLTPENIARYRQALAAHLDCLRAFCARCGIVCAVADTEAGLEGALFRDLPAAGLLH